MLPVLFGLLKSFFLSFLKPRSSGVLLLSDLRMVEVCLLLFIVTVSASPQDMESTCSSWDPSPYVILIGQKKHRWVEDSWDWEREDREEEREDGNHHGRRRAAIG